MGMIMRMEVSLTLVTGRVENVSFGNSVLGFREGKGRDLGKFTGWGWIVVQD